MNRLTFVAFWITLITVASMVQGATLVTLVDDRNTGGTAAGFVNSELPNFMLAPSSGRFSIRNSPSVAIGTWDFALVGFGAPKLMSSNTLNLNSITSFSSASGVYSAT